MMREDSAEDGNDRVGRLAESLRRHSALAFAGGLALLLGGLFFDPLFLHRSFTGRDLVAFFYPIEKAVHDAWRSGHVPLVLPELSWGKPLAANPNAGVFYPLRIAMAALPFGTAIKLFMVFHVWIAGVGAFLLSRFLGSSRVGATTTGLVFALSGPTISEMLYPDFLPGLSAIPFVILAAGRLAREPSRRRAAALAAVWGLALLIGDVFTAGLALAGAAILTVQESRSGSRAGGVGRLAFSTLPGFLIAAVQAVPAFLLIPHTVRALGRFPLRVVVTWSVSLWRLTELVVRFPFGNIAKASPIWGDALWSGKTAGFFVTLYAGALGALALVSARPPRGKRLFPYALAGISLLGAVAGFYFPRAWLERPSPIPLRYPEKLMAGFALSSALLAGALADRLLDGRGKRVWRVALAIAAVLAVSAGIVALFPHSASAFAASHWTRFPAAAEVGARSLPGILLFASLVWLAAAIIVRTAARQTSRTAASVLLLALVAADLSVHRFSFVRTDTDARVLGSPPAAGAVRRTNQGQRFGFLPLKDYYSAGFDRDALDLDSAALDGIFDVFNQDYDAADLYRVDLARQQIYRESGRWRGLPGFLSAFGARSTIVETGRMPAGFSTPVAAVGRRWLLVNASAAPLVRLAPAVEEVPGPAEAWAAVRDDMRDLVERPVVETGRSGVRQLSAGSIRITRWTPERIDVETQTDGEARLIIPRAFFPYREVRLDGRASDFEPANLLLTSVAVPAGRHVVSCEERLPGGASGPLLSLAGLLVVVLLAIRRPAGAGAPRERSWL